MLVVLPISFFSGRWAVDLVWQRRCMILSQLATCFFCTGDKFAVWTPFYFHSNIKVCGLAGQVGLAPDLARLGGVGSKVEPMCHLVGSKSRGQHLVLDLGIQPPAICCKCYCVGYPTHLSVPKVYRPGFIQAQCLLTTQTHGHSHSVVAFSRYQDLQKCWLSNTVPCEVLSDTFESIQPSKTFQSQGPTSSSLFEMFFLST